MGEKLKKSAWHSANVMELKGTARRLWMFGLAGGRVELEREQEIPEKGQLPSQVAGRGLSAIWKRSLNIAWIPADEVFLRVVQLPSSNFSELVSMVEVQLEKLSPMPVHQVVWSVAVFPGRVGDMQTAIVVIAARGAVEAFLGKVEGAGYLPDRLELPLVDQLLATRPQDEGVWIYLSNPGEPCLLAWWYGGVLQNVTLMTLPPGTDAAQVLREKIDQIAWAGELEGWLTSPPRWHLVADPDAAAVWEPQFREWAEGPVQVVSPLTRTELAAATARRSSGSVAAANLLPPEHSTRYRQQEVDRIWMGGVFAIIGVYAFGVLIYFGALTVLDMQLGKVQAEARALGPAYTNSLQLAERVQILENRKSLQFAALDSWEAVAEWLPAGVAVDDLQFQGGAKLTLRGTVPQGSEIEVTDFSQRLLRARKEGRPLFQQVSAPNFLPRGQALTWQIVCVLRTGGDQ